METSRVEFLIVDTSAFINNTQLHTIGEKIITIPEVISEVRNKRQYRHLFSLTHDIQLKDVFTESINHVSEFAKKTGDYGALSATDLKLIALTYQLEIEKVGRDHIRDTPIIAKYDLNNKIPRPESDGLNGLCLPVKLDRTEHRSVIKSTTNTYESCESNQCITELINSTKGNECNSDGENGYATAEESISDEENSEEVCYSNTSDSEEEEEKEKDGSEDADDQEEDDGDDEFGWITPSNIKKLKGSSNNCSLEVKSVAVGCLSSDFGIQNVLLQMGLNVITIDGKIIKQLRTYLLRCYACFALTSNVKKTFCPKCGNKTLKRVSVHIDKDGNKKMFINFKKPLTARGKRFSLPYPQSGKHAVNPRLVEDAKRPHQKPTKLARTKTDALDDDYIAGSAPFVMRDIHSRSAQHGFNRGKFIYKHWMQRNPNEPRRKPKK